VDAANPGFPEQIAEVQRVLGEIGAQDVPQILVFNKLDHLEIERRPLQLQDLFDLDGAPTPRLFLSAQSGEGLAGLRTRLASTVKADSAEPMVTEESPECREADL
jgi:GTP-binding protein HflX